MASILGDSGGNDYGIGSSPTTSTRPAPTTTKRPSFAAQYSWLVPTIVSVLCLVVVTFCIAWFVIYSRRRAKRYRIRGQNVDGGEQSFDDWARSSQSWSSSRRLGTNGRRATGGKSGRRPMDGRRPRLEKICESPEDGLSDGRSVTKAEPVVVHAERAGDVATIGGHSAVHRLPLAGCDACASRSSPNVLLSAGVVPYSPYRLTWISPASLDRRVVRSDPNIVRSSLAVHHRPPNSVDTSYSQSASWDRSPYNPNHNTPISSDSELNKIGLVPPNAIINRADGTAQLEHVKSAVVNTGVSGKFKTKDRDGNDEVPSDEVPTDITKPAKDLASRGQLTGRVEQGCHCDSCSTAMWSYGNPQLSVESGRAHALAYSRGLQLDRYAREMASGVDCEQCRAFFLAKVNHSVSANVGSSSASQCNQPSDCCYNNDSDNNNCNTGNINNTGLPYYNSSLYGQVDSYELTQISGNTTGVPNYSAGRSHSTSVGGYVSYLVPPRDDAHHHHHLQQQQQQQQQQHRGLHHVEGVGDLSEVNVVKDAIATTCSVASGMADGVPVGSELDDASCVSLTTSTAATSNSSSRRPSTTAHSTRSAPAAVGVRSAPSWADSSAQSRTISWTDSSAHDNTTRSLSGRNTTHAHCVNRAPLQPIQLPHRLPLVLDHALVSRLAHTPTTVPLSGYPSGYRSERAVCHMPVDVPMSHEVGGWEHMPYYGPVRITSAGNSAHTTPESLPEYGPHLHLMYTAQPILRDAQYWV